MRDAYCASTRSKIGPWLSTREKVSASQVAAAVRFGAWLVLFGAAYFLTARLSEADLFLRSRIGLLWAPGALLLSALILTSRRFWWLIFAAGSIAHVLALGHSNPPWRMAWQLAVYAGFGIAATEALRHVVGFPIRFESRRELLRYVALASIMPASIALTSPGFILSVAGTETFFSPAVEFARLLLANFTPALLVAPAVLLASRLGTNRLTGVSKRRVAEAALIMATVLVVSIFVFCSAPTIGRLPWLLVLAFPPLIWAAVRLGPSGASLSLFCVGTLSMAGAAHDLGPFVVNAPEDVVFSLQLYWVAISLPILLLAAAVRERERISRASDDRRRELADVSQVAILGELSCALANDLSQPLTAILANAPAAKLLLTRQPIDEAELRTTLGEIECDAERAKRVIDEFRLCAKSGPPRLESVDVASVARAALGLSNNVLAVAQVELQTQIAPNLPTACVDRVQLLQVVLNLITNSCDAMDGLSGPRRLRLQVTQPDRQHIEVIVADTGVGLPNGNMERVFEPFVTTKPDHLGLGLPIARSFAIAHGGQLWGETNPDGGATFHLRLPVEESAAAYTDAAAHNERG